MRPELVARYAGLRLPRYTSYPTAPRFSPAVGHEDYRHWLEQLETGLPSSLYVHVPYCRSMCWYCGCHTTITQKDEPVSDYVDVLHREIALTRSIIGSRLPIGHIHFGGGTPTIMSPGGFAGLVDFIRTAFDVCADAEIAVEIDPRTLFPELVSALACSGVTRASLGVQTFDEKVQKAVNRVQSFETVLATVELLRGSGIENLNFDLIYGLPYQTVASCLHTVEKALSLGPQRFSVFGYAHVPNFKKHQRKIDSAALPQFEERSRQERAIADAIIAAGYVRIGLDHFALPGDSMAMALEAGTLRRNFQGYTTDAGEALIGFGASAIGRLAQGYIQNEVHLLRYAQRVEAGLLPAAKGYKLTDEDRVRGDVIERIMCDFRADLAALFRNDATSGLEDVRPALNRLAADGLIRQSGTIIEVTDEARPLVRAVAAAFDAYLGTAGVTHAPAV
jgi:oxygen-independent coproporphyrinogen-3 oxidase